MRVAYFAYCESCISLVFSRFWCLKHREDGNENDLYVICVTLGTWEAQQQSKSSSKRHHCAARARRFVCFLSLEPAGERRRQFNSTFLALAPKWISVFCNALGECECVICSSFVALAHSHSGRDEKITGGRKKIILWVLCVLRHIQFKFRTKWQKGDLEKEKKNAWEKSELNILKSASCKTASMSPLRATFLLVCADGEIMFCTHAVLQSNGYNRIIIQFRADNSIIAALSGNLEQSAGKRPDGKRASCRFNYWLAAAWRQIDDVKGKRDRLRGERHFSHTISNLIQSTTPTYSWLQANICSIVQVQRTLSVSRTNEKGWAENVMAN